MQVDILIDNAAYFNHDEKYQLSPDHIELTLTTNVFGPFLMTTLLLDHLKNLMTPESSMHVVMPLSIYLIYIFSFYFNQLKPHLLMIP